MSKSGGGEGNTLKREYWRQIFFSRVRPGGELEPQHSEGKIFPFLLPNPSNHQECGMSVGPREIPSQQSWGGTGVTGGAQEPPPSCSFRDLQPLEWSPEKKWAEKTEKWEILPRESLHALEQEQDLGLAGQERERCSRRAPHTWFHCPTTAFFP